MNPGRLPGRSDVRVRPDAQARVSLAGNSDMKVQEGKTIVHTRNRVLVKSEEKECKS